MKINNLSETAVTITLGQEISLAMHRQVMGFYRYLKSLELEEFGEIVPGYASVTVFAGKSISPVCSSFTRFVEQICQNYDPVQGSDFAGRMLEIPVTYSGEDLEEVARHCGMSVQRVVDLHSEAEYVVAMMGFRPGFPYLLGLNPQLHIPRRAIPRLQVRQGAVAIGGAQTGIYPDESPGGWHIIGYTPTLLFDRQHSPPTLFEIGDVVRFVPQ